MACSHDLAIVRNAMRPENAKPVWDGRQPPRRTQRQALHRDHRGEHARATRSSATNRSGRREKSVQPQELRVSRLWLGDHQSDPALWRKVPAPEIEAWIGGKINRGSQGSTLAWLTKQKETADFVEAEVGDKRRLTMAGWMRYEELRLGRVVSRKAFMAMKFNEPIVESAYSDCFRPAARRADFDLFDLREQQRAGMIDDQMRVAIRNSRFVVADLTHACRGSYWEGGFAEGLRAPRTGCSRRSSPILSSWT